MFRQDALENRKMKWQGRAILLPGIPLWLIMLGSIVFITAFLMFIIVGTYSRRVNVSGEVTTWPRAVNIYSGVQGFVVRQFVHEGQLIKKGDPVYLIDISKSTRSGIVTDNHRRDIENQLVRVDNIISRLEESKKITLDTLEKQRLQYTDAFRRSSDIIQRAEEGIKIMKNNMENYRNYQAKGLINKDQLTNQVALYYQQQNNLLSLSGQNEQNALQITTLESQIQTQAADFDNRDSLLQVIPENIENYYLILWVPNDAVPYISAGDKVNIRYEAFPAEKFGQFSATVKTISKTPASTQEMLTYKGAPQNTPGDSVPWYKVIAMPEKQIIRYDEKYLPLENGMKAESTLFLEKRRIYQWMLSPFYDMKHSATGPLND